MMDDKNMKAVMPLLVLAGGALALTGAAMMHNVLGKDSKKLIEDSVKDIKIDGFKHLPLFGDESKDEKDEEATPTSTHIKEEECNDKGGE